MMSDKTNWMTTAQLWSQAAGNDEAKPQSLITITSPKETDDHMSSFNIVSPKLGLDTKVQRNGGAFLPFSKDRNNSCQPLPDLALASVNKLDTKCSSDGQRREINSGKVGNGTGVVINDHQQGKLGTCTNTSSDGQTTNTNSSSGQPHRKARRCWSPDLHRRFVNALQMLGGSQGIILIINNFYFLIFVIFFKI